LPKFTEATSEDKAKKIAVGGKELSGENIYRVLKEYKTEVQKSGDVIAREQKKSSFLKDRSDKIKEQMNRVDNNIDEMERKIEDYKMYQEMLAANKTIDDLGLSDDKMQQLLDTDNVLAELRKKIDENEVTLDMKDKQTDSSALKNVLTGGNQGISITDDDLL
jgi:phage shock protein A